MTIEVKIPELGENVEAGQVVNLLVDAGDHVEVDQPVIELETDKAVLGNTFFRYGCHSSTLGGSGRCRGPRRGDLDGC